MVCRLLLHANFARYLWEGEVSHSVRVLRSGSASVRVGKDKKQRSTSIGVLLRVKSAAEQIISKKRLALRVA